MPLGQAYGMLSQAVGQYQGKYAQIGAVIKDMLEQRRERAKEERGFGRERELLREKAELEKPYRLTYPQRAGLEEAKRGPTDIQLWRQAEDEVTTQLGGAQMIGIADPQARKKYYSLIEKRFNELKEKMTGISKPMGEMKQTIEEQAIAEVMKKGYSRGESRRLLGLD